MILWSKHTFWYKGLAKLWKIVKFEKGFYFEKTTVLLKKNVFTKGTIMMKIVFDKCVFNFTPVTNPTPISKSDK